MDASRASLSLLQHFDQSAAEDDAPPATAAPQPPATRGIAWVMRWAAAIAVLVYSTSVLGEFACCLLAEQWLARAARAGVLEATLPRATLRSVEDTVWRRLDGHVADRRSVSVALLENGSLAGKKFAAKGGDRLCVALTMPAKVVMPGWLRTLASWRPTAMVHARAERVKPGRELAAHH